MWHGACVVAGGGTNHRDLLVLFGWRRFPAATGPGPSGERMLSPLCALTLVPSLCFHSFLVVGGMHIHDAHARQVIGNKWQDFQDLIASDDDIQEGCVALL